MVNKPTTDMSLTGNGLRDWLAQRFTALVIAIYFIVLLGFFIGHPQLDYTSLRHFFVSTWVQVFTLTALLSLFLHAWVGIWTVITDYIQHVGMRILAQLIVILALIIYFCWGMEILWKLA